MHEIIKVLNKMGIVLQTFTIVTDEEDPSVLHVSIYGDLKLDKKEE